MTIFARPAPGLPIEQQPEGFILRACLWAEARGEGPVGMVAVAHVIRNRALNKDHSIKAVILQPLHFSSFNEHDPNREKLLTAWHDSPESWGQVCGVAGAFDAGLTVDPTHGATHYYNPAEASPPWGRGSAGWNETALLGKHVFGITA